MKTEMTRKFYPGDEWIYYKIYLPLHHANSLIGNLQKAVLPGLLRKRIIDKWFFIRYSDPDFHIRLRLHLADTANFSAVVAAVNRVLKKGISDSLIFRVQLDTYVREVERYGGTLIDDCETLFYRDSHNVANAINRGLRSELDSIAFGMAAIDQYFSLLGIPLEERIKEAERMSASYSREQGIGQPVNINKMIRNYKKFLFERVDTSRQSEKFFSDDDCPRIKASEKRNEILRSLIHMSMNRLFVTNQRLYEMICYQAILKYYEKVKKFNSAKQN